MQALLRRAGSKLRPASPYVFQIQTIGSLAPERKVVVEGLASTIDDRILREAFSPYGEVTEARVMVDRATGKSIGSGFVTYSDYDSCDRAVGSMHQWELHGQTVRVRWAPPPGGYGVDLDAIDTGPISLVGRRLTNSVRDRWIRHGYERERLENGMYLLRNYLTHLGKADIVNICQKRAMGPGGFYTPRSPSGLKLSIGMMCYGRQWDPVARYEKPDDGSDPPPIPDEFMSLVEIAIQDANGKIGVGIPSMRPDICIVNYLNIISRLALHQDCDESSESLERGSPVVYISIGSTVHFWYGPTRDEIKKIWLESGDVLIFGGPSRLYFHGVRNVLKWTSPLDLTKDFGFNEGYLSLTLKEY